jgi:hypothetical protein
VAIHEFEERWNSRFLFLFIFTEKGKNRKKSMKKKKKTNAPNTKQPIEKTLN